MSRHIRVNGLAERAAQRRKDRAAIAALKRPVSEYPKDEQRARHRAIVYLTTLPTKHLVAVHKAAIQHYENTTTP